MMFNCFSELPITISRLPVFYKQRDNYFYPAWAWSITSWILRVPLSIIEAVVWSCIVYYTVGFAPGAGRYVFLNANGVYAFHNLFVLIGPFSFVRFFRYIFFLFSVHQMALGLYRMMATIARDMVIANTFGSASMLAIFLLGGFIIPKGRQAFVVLYIMTLIQEN